MSEVVLCSEPLLASIEFWGAPYSVEISNETAPDLLLGVLTSKGAPYPVEISVLDASEPSRGAPYPVFWKPL